MSTEDLEYAGRAIADSFGMEMARKLKPTRIDHHFMNTQDDSEQSLRIISIGKEAIDLFREKNRGYGDTGHTLGAKGQFADIWRKVGKLKHTLWDGNPTVGESQEEMLMDLVGHALLTIDYLRQKRVSE